MHLSAHPFYHFKQMTSITKFYINTNLIDLLLHKLISKSINYGFLK